MNNAIIAINDKPEILKREVTAKSVFTVCSRAANDGVVLDGKEAALVIGWNGKTKSKEAQYRLMAAGVMKMIRRSPDISFIACQVVHENDICAIDFVTDGIPIEHQIDLKKPRGAPIGAYVVAKLTTGEWTSPEYMSKEEIEAIRDAYSGKDKDGNFSKMWTASPGEAWRKTVLHRAKKRLPLGEGIDQALDHDEELERSAAEAIDGETGEVATAAGKRQSRAASVVKQSTAPPAPEHTSDGSGDEGNTSGFIDAEYEDVPRGDGIGSAAADGPVASTATASAAAKPSTSAAPHGEEPPL